MRRWTYTHICIAPATPSTFVYKELPFAAPEHSIIDLTASCPRCLAKAASKPNGSEGECERTDCRLNDSKMIREAPKRRE